MEGALREDGRLVRGEMVRDAVGAVFKREFRNEASLDDDVDLRATWMGMWGIEAAGAKEA